MDLIQVFNENAFRQFYFNNRHPAIQDCKRTDRKSFLKKNSILRKELHEKIFKSDLHKKCLITKSKNFILRVSNYNKLQVISTSSGKIENTMLLPGFILDLSQNDEGEVFLLGCNDKGNFVFKLDDGDLYLYKKVTLGESYFIDDFVFLHRIHDLGDGSFLVHNPFRYSIHEFQ